MDLNLVLMTHQDALRLSFFVGLFFLVATFEWLKPRRNHAASRKTRWLNNFSLVVLASLLVRLIVPMGLVAFAIKVESSGWGLFNYLQMSDGFIIILALVVLDFAIYWQHRLFHVVPILWRLHRVHHSDPVFDVTTAVRFHPLEIVLSIFIKATFVVVLGIPAVAIIAFEIILSGVALFNHGNIALPIKLDAIVRKLIVTPDMHRVHHSDIPAETNSNYGFNLSIWDRIFDSYHGHPQKGHEAMNIGLKEYPLSLQKSHLWALIKMPFLSSGKQGQ